MGMTDGAVVNRIVRLNGHGYSVRVRDGETILCALRRAGLWVPFECGWGSCGTCKTTLISGQVKVLFPDAPAIKPQDERRRRILLCQSTPLTDIEIKPLSVRDTPRDDLPTADYKGRLVERAEVGPDIFRMRFTLDRPARFLAGQYAIVETAPGLRRCYSMTNLPGGSLVEFIVKRFPHGMVSQTLVSLPIGSSVSLEIPYGAAYLRPTGRPIVLVAGGTGIAPMLSILRALVCSARNPQVPVRVFYGAQNPASLVECSTIEFLAGQLPGSEVLLTVGETDGGWTGYRGSVLDLLASRIKDWTAHDYYVAGPPAMVENCRSLLLSRGVPITQVHYDAFA